MIDLSLYTYGILLVVIGLINGLIGVGLIFWNIAKPQRSWPSLIGGIMIITAGFLFYANSDIDRLTQNNLIEKVYEEYNVILTNNDAKTIMLRNEVYGNIVIEIPAPGEGNERIFQSGIWKIENNILHFYVQNSDSFIPLKQLN